VDAALDLCEEHGFERVTVSQIAAAAGVSEMTFFRHFPTKESVVLDDPYDPLIASQVAAQPRHWVPLRRAAEGMRAAWQSLPVPEEQDTRRRIRILAASPALRAASWRNNEETQEILTQALVAGGAPEIDARVAAAACLAAITEALMAWAGDDATSMDACITRALDVLAHGAAE
jgi:AcrR family transcriptional regulator